MYKLLTRRSSVLLAIGILLVAVAGGISYRLAFRSALLDLKSTGLQRLDLYAVNLEREVGKFAFLPGMLNLEPDVVMLLSGSEPDALAAGRVNVYLEQLNERAGTLAVYVMDASGHVRASSNWRRADSFVDEDLAFRPYFAQAMANHDGRFFGIGTTRGEPGYYLASVIADERGSVGVGVIKVSLEQLEKSWTTVEAPALVTDENGVVILSTVAGWKFATLRPLDEAARANFEKTQQFNRRALRTMRLQELEQYDRTTRLVNIASTAPEDASLHAFTGRFLSQSRTLPGTPWTFTVLSHFDQVDDIAASQAAIATFAAACLLLLGLVFNVRQRHTRERLAAREALQQAHDDLELKIKERTADLSSAIQRLQQEVKERIRIEKNLREAQNEVVQTGKLAVIGQLSTGIAHELNQPLAALRILSVNTGRFIAKGDIETARSNLLRISDLVDRMGAITGQLRNFARKSTGEMQAVTLTSAIHNALTLMQARLRQTRLQVKLSASAAEAVVYCDANRLEQVLINLIGNAIDAIDALEGIEEGAIDLSWECTPERVRLRLRDTGPGLSEEARAHLFEPFFTTKSLGKGLGLGLVISAGIVRDFGGTLQGFNHPDGGAEFILELPLVSAHV